MTLFGYFGFIYSGGATCWLKRWLALTVEDTVVWLAVWERELFARE